MLDGMIYRFDRFELDIDKAELRSDGQRRPVEPQVFALLALLVEHRDRLVSRDEILEKLWDRRVVTDSTLGSRIKSARKALGDDGRTQRFIRTIHGRGLRFVADVRIERRPPALSPGGNDDAGSAAPEAAEGAAPAARPSIAVLPFRVIGDAGTRATTAATIAEGLPHELIAELARLRWLFVIARGSSFRLGGGDMEPGEAGRVLGVRYCLTGAVEVTGRRLVVTTELIDTRDHDVVWAERYSGFVDDVHSVRADIRARILTSLEIQIPLHEAAAARLQATANLDSWSAYHLGLQHMYRFNRRDNASAAELFSHAIERDPDFARAHAGLSFVHFQSAFLRQTEDIHGEIAQARAYAQRAVDIDPLDPFANFTMGRSFWLEADLECATTWLERATSLSPNYAQGIYAHAWTETMCGESAIAREEVDLAMTLSPLDPLYYAMVATRGFIHMAREEYDEAARWADRAARSPGAHVLIAMIAAAAQEIAGEEARARKWAANVRARNPSLTRRDFFRSFPLQQEAMHARISAALEKLGF
jgi:TolB-like protein